MLQFPVSCLLPDFRVQILHGYVQQFIQYSSNESEVHNLLPNIATTGSIIINSLRATFGENRGAVGMLDPTWYYLTVWTMKTKALSTYQKGEGTTPVTTACRVKPPTKCQVRFKVKINMMKEDEKNVCSATLALCTKCAKCVRRRHALWATCRAMNGKIGVLPVCPCCAESNMYQVS